MSSNRKEKKLARERVLQTGQSYVAALRDIRREFAEQQSEVRREG